MAWTTPRTWIDSEIVTADQLNAHIRDNLNLLKGRIDGIAKQYIRTATDYTTTSTTLTAVDGANMVLTFTTSGGDVRVTFAGYGDISSGSQDVTMAVLVDATPYEVVAQQLNASGNPYNLSFSFVITGLSAASHTFTLQWKVTANTARLFAGAILFDVREEMGIAA